MSFQDIEAGQGLNLQSTSFTPQSREDNEFRQLQSSLSLQVFKMNANVQGILKLVDQLGTPKDSAGLRKTLCVWSLVGILTSVSLSPRHDLAESTRAMAKRSSEDLKKLSTLQSSLVSKEELLLIDPLPTRMWFSPIRRLLFRKRRMICKCRWLLFNERSK